MSAAAGHHSNWGGASPKDNAPLMGGASPAGGGYQHGGGYPPPGAGGYPSAAGPYADPYGQQGGALKAMSSGNHMNDVFFAAACCIILGSFIGGSALLFRSELVDWLEMTFLLIFGVALAVLDTPLMKTIKLVMDAKKYIGKYVQFVTRLTGKGITLVFLGSSLFLTMWDNLDSGFLKFLAVVLCFVPVLVGLCAVVIGALKTKKLDAVRKQLVQVVEQRYDALAQTFPGQFGGMTMTEFNRLTFENAGGVKFETQDLKLIFNALISNPSWRQQATGSTTAQSGYQSSPTGDDAMKVPKQDLLDWCRDGLVLL